VSKRAVTVPATGITLDPAGQLPMHRQLYQRLRAAILAGELPPGTRLPSTRSLATELGVSRITALTAYEQLRDEGYLDGRVGAGTTVAALSGPGLALLARTHTAPQAPRPVLSARGATMAGDRWRLRPPDWFGAGLPAFPLGLPALDAFRTMCGLASSPAAPGARSTGCSATRTRPATGRCGKRLPPT
jgi:GntR family transcriptional regulator / MocR family aminotransferase